MCAGWLQVANARELEGSKGLLGVIGDKLLNAAHLRRSNTREGASLTSGGAKQTLLLVWFVCGAHVAAKSVRRDVMWKDMGVVLTVA